ncbi:MAG: AAA family ATPase [Desulfovibrionaceae bacterium]|nr:AAA family ATPase [Desulfovibrionaceae bacterium]
MLDDKSLKIVYEYKIYNFLVEQSGKIPFKFNQLPDGYASIFYIFTDILMRREHNWLEIGDIFNYDVQGIVLIDEIESHLHIELQEKFLRVLCILFPNIQFIVSSHSPYILANAPKETIVFDLEKQSLIGNISDYSPQSIAEGYFDACDNFQNISNDLNIYFQLEKKSSLSEEEKSEKGRIRSKLSSIPSNFLRIVPNVSKFLSLNN